MVTVLSMTVLALLNWRCDLCVHDHRATGTVRMCLSCHLMRHRYYLLLATYYLPLTTYHLLLTTYYFLLTTTYYVLLTAKRGDRVPEWLAACFAHHTESNKGARLTFSEQQFGPTHRVRSGSGPAKEVASLAYYSLLTTYYLLLTNYYLLITTYCVLLTTYYLLLTTYH